MGPHTPAAGGLWVLKDPAQALAILFPPGKQLHVSSGAGSAILFFSVLFYSHAFLTYVYC